MKTMLLDEKTLRQVLEMKDLIPLMERALADFSTGKANQPVRSVLYPEGHHSVLGVMPGFLPENQALGVKVVTFVPRNAEIDLPTHLATILLHDPATGALLSIMDGRLITEMRTAAVSAAASKALAAPGSKVLAILGSGVQARSHLEAFSVVHRLSEVRVWSRTPASREAFVAEIAKGGGPRAVAAPTAEEAVRGADLVVTVTSSRTPVLEGRWLKEGMHLTAAGACAGSHRELDGEAVRRSRVFVDSIAAARVEAGDILIAEQEKAIGSDHVAGEIGAVFARTLPGRASADQITLFKSLGLAVEDVATAGLVYRLACERKVGVEVGI